MYTSRHTPAGERGPAVGLPALMPALVYIHLVRNMPWSSKDKLLQSYRAHLSQFVHSHCRQVYQVPLVLSVQ